MKRLRIGLLTAALGLALTLLALGCAPSGKATVAPQPASVPEAADQVMEGMDDMTHGASEAAHLEEADQHMDEADQHMDEAAEAHGDEEEGLMEVKVNVVEGKRWYFEPASINLTAGHRVKLTLVNTGMAEHDVEFIRLTAEHIERVGGEMHGEGHGDGHEGVVAAHAMPGTMASVLFTPTQPGEYVFICTLPGHKEAGMVGKLVVQEADAATAKVSPQ